MPMVELEFPALRDPRLSAQLAESATGPSPAWLWSADGSRILWANAAGAAIFGAADSGACGSRRFAVSEPAAAQIMRLAQTLPPAGQTRLERLRGFGAGFGRALTCACSRTALGDGTPAVFVIATDTAGPPLTLHERVRRLFADREMPRAVFAADGALLDASAAATRRLAGAEALSALGIEAMAAQALAAGRASGDSRYGPLALERLGREASTVLVLTFAPEPTAAPAARSVATEGEPAPAAPDAAAASASAGAAATLPPPASAPDEAPHERRHPLRFVWQMDADGHFVVGSDEFVEFIGPRTTAAFGRLWSEIAADLKLDPDNQIARAVATHETWSGITLSWPVEEGAERLPVELSGLPVFDRDRTFRGYRGFGVCRDIARINQLAHARRERPIGFMEVAVAPAAVEAAEMPAASAAASGTAEVVLYPARSAADAAPVAANVLQFRPGPPSEAKTPSLSPVERRAFRELAQELTARLRGEQEAAAHAEGEADTPAAAQTNPAEAAETVAAAPAPEMAPAASAEDARHSASPPAELVLLDRVPAGVLVHRHDTLLYANRRFLEWSGYESLDALAAAGGLDALFAEPGAGALAEADGARSLTIMTQSGERFPVEGRLFAVPWHGASALALILASGETEERQRATAAVLGAAEKEIGELHAALGAAENEIGKLEATLEPLTRLGDEMRAAKREAEKAMRAKADFLTKVSHEIRTPLNAITGFAEVIMAERFGPIGNERYREYLKDIHAAGSHLISLLNDLLDLSKIETGQLDLAFANVSLNELTQQCVGIMQPQASRARIIIRTSLTPGLPQVVADERSLRQIVLNLLSNSIRFTGPGGQVIVSTVFADNGEAVLRVRDTGVGMSDKDIEAAMEPFRQTAISGSWGSGGTGLGLPLTKALAEANRANFSIKSAPNAGTLVEVAFPPTRVAQ
jgi:signal transduction histidine kinase